MKQAFLYVLAFIGIQLAGGAAGTVVWRLFKGDAPMSATGLIATTAVVNILIIALFIGLRWTTVSRRYVQSRPWGVLFWCVLAALGAIIPSMRLQELMPELPNVAEQQFDMILKERWGYLTIGLLAPVAEELVFRGAVLRALLPTQSNGWLSIAISAVLFAFVHANPAQMPHAFLIGLLLGWLYVRTGSIVPGVAYHWVNNTVAYVMYNLYPDPSLQLIDIFGGSGRAVMAAVFFSLCIFAPAIYQLHLRMRRA